MSADGSLRDVGAAMDAAAESGAAARTPEIEDITNARFIHPLSWRATKHFAHWGVAPNAVSFAGMGCGLLAGVAYYHYPSWWGPPLGLILMIGWHILDGSDGQLARLTNRQSEFGKVIDGICDYVTFIAVYVGLGLAMAQRYGPSIWWLLVVAGAAHAVQAAAYEVQRQEYDVSVHGRRSAELPRMEDLRAQGGGLLNRIYRAYVRTQYLVAGGAPMRRERIASALSQRPMMKARIQERYRALFAAPVRAWGLLSANYRTIGIFAASVAAAPWLYFLWEIFGLSLVMAWRIRAQRRDWIEFSRFLDELNTTQDMGDGYRMAGLAP